MLTSLEVKRDELIGNTQVNLPIKMSSIPK
jgi:hypothetical protein